MPREKTCESLMFFCPVFSVELNCAERLPLRARLVDNRTEPDCAVTVQNEFSVGASKSSLKSGLSLQVVPSQSHVSPNVTPNGRSIPPKRSNDSLVGTKVNVWPLLDGGVCWGNCCDQNVPSQTHVSFRADPPKSVIRFRTPS